MHVVGRPAAWPGKAGVAPADSLQGRAGSAWGAVARGGCDAGQRAVAAHWLRVRAAIPVISRLEAREMASMPRRLEARRPISLPPLTRTSCQLAEAATTAPTNAPASAGVSAAAEARRPSTRAAQ